MDTAYDPRWLDREMTDKGLSVAALSEASGVSRSQVQRIRGGMAPRMGTYAALRTGIEKLASDVAVCSRCEERADGEVALSCTSVHCPMRRAEAA